MPRGDNPNSRANLKPPTSKEARERGAKGGRATAEMNRKLKTFQELDQENTTDEERNKMLAMLKKRALQGNLRAFELYANYMGLKPAEKIAVEAVDEEVISGLKEAIESRRSNEAAD